MNNRSRAHIGQHEIEAQLVGMVSPDLPELLRFAADWLEERRRKRGIAYCDPEVIAYHVDDQGYWLMLTMAD